MLSRVIILKKKIIVQYLIAELVTYPPGLLTTCNIATYHHHWLAIQMDRYWLPCHLEVNCSISAYCRQLHVQQGYLAEGPHTALKELTHSFCAPGLCATSSTAHLLWLLGYLVLLSHL